MLPEPPASGSSFSHDEAERTSRQRALPFVGDVGQRRLAGARVLVIGAGGLGHPVGQYLAAAGVGRLDLVDDDLVERSNLARQVCFTAAHLGLSKASVLAGALAQLAPASRVVGHSTRVDAGNVGALLARLDPHVVVDTTDDWPTRLAVADTCRVARVPLVWPTAVATDGQLTVFSSEPGDPTIDDLVERDTAPAHPVSCAEQGVLGPLCGQLGAMAAGEVLKLLLGAGRPLIGRVAVVDALGATVREVPLVPRAPGGATPAAGTTPRGRRARAFAVAAAAEPPRDEARRTAVVSIDELAAAPLGTVLIDAREGHAPPLDWPLPGLELVELVREPLESLAAAIDAGELPRSIERASRVAVACAFGPRARHAAAMLRAAGVAGVAVLDEGTAGLRARAAGSHRVGAAGPTTHATEAGAARRETAHG